MAAEQAPPERRGIRIIDDNEDGAFFYGSGGFAGATGPASAIADASGAKADASDLGPSLPARQTSTQPSKSAWGVKEKPAWASIAAKHLPAKNEPVAVPSASGEPKNEAAELASSSGGGGSSTASSLLCVYFLGGWCRFGERCKFRHAKADSDSVSWFQAHLQAALDAGQGTGKGQGKGPVAPASRGAQDAASTYKAPVEDEIASAAWQAAASTLRTEILDQALAEGVCSSMDEASVALQQAERALSEGVECGICLERVMEVPGRRFGLLTGCMHAFCLDCIRQWRGRLDLPSDTTRACPLCRQTSHYIIPSDRYIADTARKAAVSADYHASQSAIPCKWWDLGRGTCPFGSSCFYAHLNLDGSAVVQSGRHTFLMDQEGQIIGGKKAYQLAQFL